METTPSAAAFHAKAAHHHLQHLADIDQALHGAADADVLAMIERLGEIIGNFLAIDEADRKLDIAAKLGVND